MEKNQLFLVIKEKKTEGFGLLFKNSGKTFAEAVKNLATNNIKIFEELKKLEDEVVN